MGQGLAVLTADQAWTLIHKVEDRFSLEPSGRHRLIDLSLWGPQAVAQVGSHHTGAPLH